VSSSDLVIQLFLLQSSKSESDNYRTKTSRFGT